MLFLHWSLRFRSYSHRNVQFFHCILIKEKGFQCTTAEALCKYTVNLKQSEPQNLSSHTHTKARVLSVLHHLPPPQVPCSSLSTPGSHMLSRAGCEQQAVTSLPPLFPTGPFSWPPGSLQGRSQQGCTCRGRYAPTGIHFPMEDSQGGSTVPTANECAARARK